MIATKMVISFLIVVIVWEIPGVFELLWSPFTFLLGKFTRFALYLCYNFLSLVVTILGGCKPGMYCA